MTKPKLLYKYCTSETAKIVLNSCKLRWNSPVNFNDSFEFSRMPTFDIPIIEAYPLYIDRILGIVFEEQIFEPLSNDALKIVEICKALKEKGYTKSDLCSLLKKIKVPNDFDDMLEEQLRKSVENYDNNNFRVLSLTDLDNDDIMWQRYADNRKGCILTFKPLANSDTPLTEVEKVTYSEEPFSIYRTVDFLMYGDSLELRSKTRKGIYYNKEMKWSDENEWRLITIRKTVGDSNYSDFDFFKEELISITIGHLINISDKETIISIVNKEYPNCKIFQLKEDEKI